MNIPNNYIKKIVSPILKNYINKKNYNKNSYDLVSKLIDNLDKVCVAFFNYNNKTESYKDQLNTLKSIAEHLENTISLIEIESSTLKTKILDLLDFRNIPNFDKKKQIYDIYVNKCLSIVIEYMVYLNILSKDGSKEYLRISLEGFVPV